MASTTFSGPVTSTNGFIGAVTGAVTGDVTTSTLVLGGTASGASIADVTSTTNTVGKVTGLVLVDPATGIFYFATGSAAADPWGRSTGTQVTPS